MIESIFQITVVRLIYLALFSLFFLLPISAKSEVIITPSEVYTQALVIEQETRLIKRHLNIEKPAAEKIELTAHIEPRHVWQKGYMLQIKLVMFRRKHQLNAVSPVDMEPLENIDSSDTWAQTQRILTEIRIIKKLLGITGEITQASNVADKKPVDVFNKLSAVEAEWDTLIGSGFDSSYVFDQVLRLNEDVNIILRQLNLFDNAVLPAKNRLDTPSEALTQAFSVLDEVQRIQKAAGLRTADLSGFKIAEKEQITPDDAFNLVCLILAEVQQIKARAGLVHSITPAASYHENKQPADVRQFLGYIVNKLALIEHL